MGELCYFDDELDDMASLHNNYDMDEFLAELIRIRDKTYNTRPYAVVVATTPDKEEWVPIHWVLTLADFKPVAEGRTQHGGQTYNNILWVFQRNNKEK
jgi:hypothetical protein